MRTLTLTLFFSLSAAALGAQVHLSASGCETIAGNLLINCGFEVERLGECEGGLPCGCGWNREAEGQAGCMMDGNHSRSNINSGHIYSGQRARPDYYSRIYQVVNANPGARFRFGAWLCTPPGYNWLAGSLAYVRVSFHATNGDELSSFKSPEYLSENQEWQLFDGITSPAPERTARARFSIVLQKPPIAGSQSIVNADDCFLIPLSDTCCFDYKNRSRIISPTTYSIDVEIASCNRLARERVRLVVNNEEVYPLRSPVHRDTNFQQLPEESGKYRYRIRLNVPWTRRQQPVYLRLTDELSCQSHLEWSFPANLYVVSIGIPYNDLPFTTDNARVFTDYVKSQRGVFGNVIFVDTIFPKKPVDKSRLEEAFSKLREAARQADSGDALMVFISGHGTTFNLQSGEERYGFPATNYNRERPGSYCLDLRTVSDAMNAFPGINKFLFVDACQSGLVVRDISPEIAWFISGREPQSWGCAKLKHSVFTWSLLKAFSGEGIGQTVSPADQSQPDQVISFRELAHFLEGAIPQAMTICELPPNQTPGCNRRLLDRFPDLPVFFLTGRP